MSLDFASLLSSFFCNRNEILLWLHCTSPRAFIHCFSSSAFTTSEPSDECSYLVVYHPFQLSVLLGLGVVDVQSVDVWAGAEEVAWHDGAVIGAGSIPELG